MKAKQKRNESDTINKNDNNDKNEKKKERGDIFLKAWKDFKKMWNKIKKPMTEKAEEILLNKLDGLSDNELDQVAILNESVLHCWQSVYALKGDPADDERKQKWDKKDVPAMTPEQVARDKARMKELANMMKGIGDMPETAKGG